MAWWIWLLIGFGGYILVGIGTAAYAVYNDGRNHPDNEEADLEDAALCVFAWPLYLVVVVSDVCESSFKFLYRYGQSSNLRKEKRQEKHDYKQMIEEFAKEHGLDAHKLKSPVG